MLTAVPLASALLMTMESCPVQAGRSRRRPPRCSAHWCWEWVLTGSVHLLTHARTAAGRGTPERAVLRGRVSPSILSAVHDRYGFGALDCRRCPSVSSWVSSWPLRRSCCGLCSVTVLPAVLALLRRGRGGGRRRRGDRVARDSCRRTRPGPGRSSPRQDAGAIREDRSGVVRVRSDQDHRHLSTPVRVRGAMVFQKPMLLKLELTGDAALSIVSNSRRLWIVDTASGEVDELDCTALGRDSRLLRVLPTVFLEISPTCVRGSRQAWGTNATATTWWSWPPVVPTTRAGRS